jgi:hypothetical protein
MRKFVITVYDSILLKNYTYTVEAESASDALEKLNTNKRIISIKEL